jgi:glycerate dehydrogenase
MKIVILDSATLGGDIDLSPIKTLGETKEYKTTQQGEVAERIADADVVVINKIKLGAQNLSDAKSLKLICVAATGYDNIDTAYCKERGIALCNVPGYSNDSVAQLSVAMVLYLFNHLPEYCRYVSSGDYSRSGVANRLEPLYHEIAGKTWGIVGAGGIGSRVAEIASALGCRVIVFRRKSDERYPTVDIDTLCRESDVITVHLPLSDSTRGIISRERIAMMKKNAIFVNTARGAVADESALADAIKNRALGGIGVDVYSSEPFGEEHPFYEIMKMDNVCLTPHVAWGSVEARERCVGRIAENIKAFFGGDPINRIV